jgi:hypothetical protein
MCKVEPRFMIVIIMLMLVFLSDDRIGVKNMDSYGCYEQQHVSAPQAPTMTCRH